MCVCVFLVVVVFCVFCVYVFVFVFLVSLVSLVFGFLFGVFWLFGCVFTGFATYPASINI